jgi:hypothetical protein
MIRLPLHFGDNFVVEVPPLTFVSLVGISEGEEEETDEDETSGEFNEEDEDQDVDFDED